MYLIILINVLYLTQHRKIVTEIVHFIYSMLLLIYSTILNLPKQVANFLNTNFKSWNVLNVNSTLNNINNI